MVSKIGKVVKFDKLSGEIIDSNDKYLFLHSDIIGDIKIGDIVIFKAEVVQGENRAYFVESYDKKINNMNKNNKIYTIKNIIGNKNDI
mgnify:CR=1 FL=1